MTLDTVAWCAGCKWYCPADEIGSLCPGDGCGRRLRKRVGYICPSCEVRNIFWTKAEFKGHQHA